MGFHSKCTRVGHLGFSQATLVFLHILASNSSTHQGYWRPRRQIGSLQLSTPQGHVRQEAVPSCQP